MICSLSLGCVYLSMVHTDFGVRLEPRLVWMEDTVILVSGQRDAMVLHDISPVLPLTTWQFTTDHVSNSFGVVSPGFRGISSP